MPRFCLCLVVSCLLTAWPAAAQAPPSELPPGFEGAPAPVLPDTISRDAAGHVTVRAIRLTSPLRLDGRLDEAGVPRGEPRV
jgi:hypothetical protein